MKDCIKCKDCKFFNAWRTLEGTEKHGQIYECSKLVISCPSPDDYCSKAEGMTDCRPNSAVDIVRCGNCKYYKDHHCTYIYQISIPLK